MTSVKNVETLLNCRSDHSVVVLPILFNNFRKGKGVWKFNNSLLKDREYAEIVITCIKRVKKQYMLPVYNLDYINNRNY